MCHRVLRTARGVRYASLLKKLPRGAGLSRFGLPAIAPTAPPATGAGEALAPKAHKNATKPSSLPSIKTNIKTPTASKSGSVAPSNPKGASSADSAALNLRKMLGGQPVSPPKGSRPAQHAPAKLAPPPSHLSAFTASAKGKPRATSAKGAHAPPAPVRKPRKPRVKPKISIPRFCTVSNLATIINVKVPALVRNLTALGFEGMNHDYILDQENATLIADEYGFEVVMSDETGIDIFSAPINEKLLTTRAPIVTIMGHVDHGKTTILDYLRKSSIVEGEHGGITQHIGAFSVITPVSKKSITFLDTPGHAAFLKMRERGANVTDIVVLVVAADDSVKPQTIEAIKHAQKANVQMIVAINKCDKPGAKPDRVVADLSSHGVDVEDYGGDVQVVRVSGKTGLNMDKLEESIVTLSEIMLLRAEASEKIAAEGWVIESHLKKGLGSVATVLVTRGLVKSGTVIVAGKTYCKVKSMKDEYGKPVRVAHPSQPVEVWGWKELPEAGDAVIQAESEKVAKKVVENRATRAKTIDEAKDVDAINEMRKKQREEAERLKKVEELKKYGLEGTAMNTAVAEETCKHISFIIKADVSGSAEAVKESIASLGNEEVKVRVLYEAVGPPTETDLERAKTSNSHILTFNIDTPKDVERKAYLSGVEIKSHNIIYHLIEDVTDILTASLAPEIQTRYLGEAEIKAIFEVKGKNKKVMFVAGCKVTNGTIKRNQLVKVFRNEKEVFSGALTSLKHMKTEEAEIKKGSECGIAFDGFDDFKEGDMIKPFELVEVARFL